MPQLCILYRNDEWCGDGGQPGLAGGRGGVQPARGTQVDLSQPQGPSLSTRIWTTSRWRQVKKWLRGLKSARADVICHKRRLYYNRLVAQGWGSRLHVCGSAGHCSRLKVGAYEECMQGHTSSLHSTLSNIAKGTTDPRVEFCLPK